MSEVNDRYDRPNIVILQTLWKATYKEEALFASDKSARMAADFRQAQEIVSRCEFPLKNWARQRGLAHDQLVLTRSEQRLRLLLQPRQNCLSRDRHVAHSDTNRIVDRVGDSRRDYCGCGLPDTAWVMTRIDELDIDWRHVR